MAKNPKFNQHEVLGKDALSYWGGIRPVVRRLGREPTIEKNRQAIATELLCLGVSNITEIMEWDDNGKVKFRSSRAIDPVHLKAIRKVKATSVTDKDGNTTNTLEVELWDKVSALRILARAAGLLDNPEDDSDKPSVIGISMRGPDPAPEPTTTYQEVPDEPTADATD